MGARTQLLYYYYCLNTAVVRCARTESRALSVPMTVSKRLPSPSTISLYIHYSCLFFYFPYFGGRKFPEPNTSHVPVVMTIIISKANNTVHIISRSVFRWRVLYKIILIYYNTIMSRRKAFTHTLHYTFFSSPDTLPRAQKIFIRHVCVCVYVYIGVDKKKKKTNKYYTLLLSFRWRKFPATHRWSVSY